MEPKESPYYYGNKDCPPTVLVLKSHDAPLMTCEMPWDATIEDLCSAFYGACVGVAFDPQTVLKGMKEFALEHLPDEDNE